MTHRDRGSALAMTMLVCTLAAGLGLIATLAVQRSVAAEVRIRRQATVDNLAAAGAEEAVGRLVGAPAGDPAAGITALLAHPGIGTGDGPWVRFGTDGQVIDCTAGDAREACFTLRVAGTPDLTAPAGVTELLVEVTARQCRGENAATSSCVRSRVQTTMISRVFDPELVWLATASTSTMFATGDVIDGPMRIEDGAFVTCGSPALGGSAQRIAAVGSSATVVADGCTGTPTLSSTVVTDADAVAQPAPADLAALAAVSVAEISGATAPTVEVRGSTIVVNGGAPVDLPVDGVVYIDDDVTVSMDPTDPLQGRVTLAAAGTITVTTDLRVADLAVDMLGLVSLGGDIDVPFDGSARNVEALLVATAPSPNGVVRATDICTDVSCATATLTLHGAIVARRLDPIATVDSDGTKARGYVADWVFDSRFATAQPPYALLRVRGRWLRIDRIHTAPLAPGA